MKKIYLLFLGAFIAVPALAQTQRTVLVEEFTQASCGPCASQNPAFNTLLSANTAKAVSIKYQTSWPGVDPMNAANPAQVQTRVTYYNVTGVPNGLVDGTKIANDCSAYLGAPACLSQAEIDAAYAITSPFALSVTHTLSSDFDSIYITANISAAQAFSAAAANSLRLHLVIVEEEIHYDNPPGSNGEKDFYGIMRKMLPSDQGTTLADTWTNGQNATVTIGAPIPSYLCDLNELAVVGFIQENNANKNVHQAAISNPVMFAEDAGVSAITNVPVLTCAATFTPSVNVKNFGSTTLTSGTISYQVDAGTISTQAWTGNLAPGATASVALSTPVTTTAGTHTITAWMTGANGNPDYNEACNQTKSAQYAVVTNAQTGFTQESFQATTFPPTNWVLENPDGGATWQRRTSVGGFGGSTAASRMYFYNSLSGNVDNLYMPALNMSAATAPQVMTFHLAYAQYTTENDKLEVQASTDCGATWSTLWTKSGSTMSTAPATTSNFTPAADQWRTEEVDLATVVGQPHVMIRFKATSAYGNNLFIDNINIAAVNSVSEAASQLAVNVFPNPASTNLNVNLFLDNSETVAIKIIDVNGKVVVDESRSASAGENNFVYSLEALSSGLYHVNILAGEKSTTRNVQVIK